MILPTIRNCRVRRQAYQYGYAFAAERSMPIGVRNAREQISVSSHVQLINAGHSHASQMLDAERRIQRLPHR